ncbi:autotransporter outer membrane beta-barrel domain-containing protein [Cognatiyoonia sp. IB215182]|uniref:autotransporter family protein n=1 Tax=Cognatiyoonia sp. IB215182 TaxID=3097353 RepID=UPI002A105F87|nr:autotransporter outer membrane beta-barrel domain-containing protein [Cognatiyoonia sp. IB215182]MDX8355831.1 autotransporter outer membrane beta-barrel domain-containing protein [Cognatiyoonia sp. IB215182]
MTNQSPDTQPALRPFNVLVRGGRLTRFKGQVASIAPGLLVVATAAALLAGGADQAAAQATAVRGCAGETGNAAVGSAVTCNTGNYSDGIQYDTIGTFTLTLDAPGIDVGPVGRRGVDVGSGAADDVTVQMGGGTITTTAGFDNHGIRVDGGNSATSTAKVAVTGGEIEIDGENSVGLYSVVSGNGNAIAELGGNSSIAASIATKGENSHGIDALVNNRESTATATALLNEGGEIETKKANSEGMIARTSGKSGEALAHMSGGKITTHGEVIREGTPQERTGFAHAVSAILDQGAKEDSKANMTARMTGGEIETMRNNSSGVRAYNRGLGNALAQMDQTDGRSTIITHENQSHGLQAFATPEDMFTTAEGIATAAGVAEAAMVDGTIIVNGVNAHGMYAQANGVLGTALVKMDGGRITTTHRNAAAIYARIDNQNHKNNADKTNGVKVIMTGGSILTENRPGSVFGSHGIYADTTGSADVTVDMRDGTITTVGRNSHGIYAEFEGAGDDGQAIVKLGTEAWVTASGAGSDGIRAQGRRGFDVYVAGRVTGGADGFNADANGAAIRTISAADGGGTIHITDTATVTAGRSGLAIQDWDGDTAVTLEGAMTGDIRLRGGNDSVTIAATASYDFSYTLDGGLGDYDHLILSGRTMTSMENVIDWEHLTLKDETKLSLDKGAILDMDLLIEAGSVFSASGGDRGTGATIEGKVSNVPGGGLTITGDVTNSGTLSVQDGVAGDVITIEGNYTGSGRGVFQLDAVMGPDGANTDRLEITGNASGEMVLSLAGLDSTAPEGGPLAIYLVSVGGETDDATFTLMDGNYVMSDGEQAMISGAHLYRLAEVEVAAQDGGSSTWWALSARSESGEVTYQPSAPVYDSYGASLLAFNAPSGLHARGSAQDFRSLAWGGAGADAADQDTGTPLWIRMGTEQLTTSEEHSTTGAALESSLWEMEIGADLTLNSSDAGLLVGGLMFSYGTGSTDVSSDLGDGSIETSGLGLGLAATWYDARRFYVDGQVTLSSYTSDLTSDRLGTLIEGNSGTGYALSLEAGQQLDLGTRLTVTPQSQLSLSSVTFSDFTSEAHQEAVALSDASSQQLRLGLEVAGQERGESGLYGIVNLYHEFGAGSEVEVAGTSLTTEREPWTLGAGLGGSYVLTERVDLFGDVAYATGLSNAGDTSALSANAGLKVVF